MSTLPQKSPSVTAAKGLLITKSSPLATESCKLEKQFITAQNMTSHYKKILNAKPSIDTSPPKSLTKSVKARDRVKRELLQLSWANKNSNRPKSAENPVSIADEKSESKSLTTVSRTLKTEESNSRTMPNQNKLNKSMCNMVANFTKHNPNRIMLYKPHEQEKTQFVNPFSTASDNKQTDRAAKEMLTTLLFNVHAKNDPNLTGLMNPSLKAMSRLVSGHNYDVLDLHADKFTHPNKDFQPRIKNLEKSSKLRESKYYEPPRRPKKNTPAQNKLNSKRNNEEEIEDNEKAANYSRIYDSKNFDQSDEEDLSPRKLNSSEIMNVSFGSKKLTASQISLKRAAEKEEQLKYIEFLKDVTTDILERGICSNKVISNCFNFHLKKNKNRLDERKMREILDSLRSDIGIPNETDAEIDSNLYQTVNKALLMDKEQNKENLNVENEYLSLKKFGYPSRVNSSRSLIGDDKSELNISHGKKLFDDYENQIIQNIQTIRRKSSSSGNEPSRKNSIESDKSTPKISRQNSILKKSPSQSSLPSRKESLETKNRLVSSTQEIEALNDRNNNNDDDDVFVSSTRHSTNVSNNNSRRSSQTKENSKINSVVDEDALFNDNYGEPESDSAESENDDQFNEMKIQLKNRNLRKKSSESNESEHRSRSIETPTPTPKPRTARNISNENKKNENTSDEDDF